MRRNTNQPCISYAYTHVYRYGDRHSCMDKRLWLSMTSCCRRVPILSLCLPRLKPKRSRELFLYWEHRLVLCTYGLYRYGLFLYWEHRLVLCSYGLYSYGPFLYWKSAGVVNMCLDIDMDMENRHIQGSVFVMARLSASATRTCRYNYGFMLPLLSLLLVPRLSLFLILYLSLLLVLCQSCVSALLYHC